MKSNITEKREQERIKFLIYIVKQNVRFKDEAVTIIFFKDITFGVLYE